MWKAPVKDCIHDMYEKRQYSKHVCFGRCKDFLILISTGYGRLDLAQTFLNLAGLS